MKTIKVREIVQDDSVLGRFRSGELRRLAVEALKQEQRVRFDFDGSLLITQSAADEFVGRLRRYDEPWLDGSVFASCSEDVSHMLHWAMDKAFSVSKRQAALGSEN
jgi:hypothetical protein